MLEENIPLIRGRRFGLSRSRKFMSDLMWAARKVPSVPMQRTMRLSDLVRARAARGEQRISWCAIFLKAYSIVAAERPELRRSFLTFPWPHMYEHPENVASFSLEREYQGEKAVFFARIARPESISLLELDKIVKAHKQTPIEEVASYRQALLLSSLPLPLRRFIWWLGLSQDGMYRARFFGTFAISVVASQGAAGLHLLSPLTTTLNYSPFADDHSIDVRLAYDHRVLDGAVVARALVHLEEVLHGAIYDELDREASALSNSPPPLALDRLLETPSSTLLTPATV